MVSYWSIVGTVDIILLYFIAVLLAHNGLPETLEVGTLAKLLHPVPTKSSESSAGVGSEWLLYVQVL